MPLSAPTFQSAVLSSARDTSTLTSASFTPSNGDIIIVKGLIEDTSGSRAYTTPTGGSQTYTPLAISNPASNTYAALWYATVSGSPGSMTVAVAMAGGASVGWHSIVVEQWTGAQLAGSPAVNATKTGSGAPSTTLTTAAAGSAVSWCSGDWNAVAPGTPAYRSSAVADTGTPHDKSPSSYVGYFAYQAAASAGSQTMGLTSPTGQQWNLIGIEIQDAGGGAVVTPARALVVPTLAAIQAGSW